MKLTGKLKKQVEAAATMEEKKDAIENAGMLLDDEELAVVAGGSGIKWTIREMTQEEYYESIDMHICPECGESLRDIHNMHPDKSASCYTCGIQWLWLLF